MVYLSGERRTHYEAVAELRNLVGRFLRQQLLPNFEDSPARLARITSEARKLTGEQRDFAISRAKMLKSWEKNSRRVLPFLMKMLGS